MATAPPNVTKTAVARVPYLNCAPFFEGLLLGDAWEWVALSPHRLGVEAEAGRVTAGPMSLADFLRLQDRFERLGPLGIATRGRCGSALLFSRKPLRQLEAGSTIAVTDDTSTTVLLLRLILEQRYRLEGIAYRRAADLPAAPGLSAVPGTAQADAAQAGGADAVLLIGDEALRFRAGNRTYPFETDVGFEWWLWQHLPTVFAVWAIRKDCAPSEKQQLSRLVQQQLARNLGRLETIAGERAKALGLPASELQRYLENFIYRLSDPEEQAIARFDQLLHDHHLS